MVCLDDCEFGYYECVEGINDCFVADIDIQSGKCNAEDLEWDS